MDKIKMI